MQADWKVSETADSTVLYICQKKYFVKSKPTPKKHKPEQKYRGGILNILQMDEADGIHASEIGVLTLNVRPE